jgi:hypothetical protein
MSPGDQLMSSIAVLRGARLNQSWPDVRAIARLLGAMQQANQPIEFSSAGLPGYRAWQRVASDAALAVDGRAALGSRSALAQRATQRGLPIDHGQLARFDYYTWLIDQAVPTTLDTVDVQVRRIDGATAHLRIVLDKVLTDGRWVRVTADVAQRGLGLAQLDADLAEPTAGLRSLVFRSAELSVDLLWIALADRPEFTVEQVVKGEVGPLRTGQTGWQTDWPAPSTQSAILDCVLERAALDLSGDDHRDPFTVPTPTLRAAQVTYGFNCTRARRFVCTPDVRGWLTAAMRPHRCVVRAIRQRRA